MDLLELGAAQAAAALRNGDVSASEYADALIAQAEALADLNAFIHFDPEQVRGAALAADAKRASGSELGPLHGVPLVLKDNIDVAGIPNTGGTPALRRNVPDRNAPVAQALFDAGAICLGKANLHELAFGTTTNNGAFGAAHNPYDPTRIPGGSSGGTGAAVAARMAPAGLGSDTGGSVRIPAGLCGIVGFRPTTGRYPGAGIVPIAHTRDTAGPMARRVEDIVLLDGLMSGAATALEPSGLGEARIGIPRRYFYEDNDEDVLRVVEQALERWRGYGIELVEVDIPDIQAAHEAANFPVILYEATQDIEHYAREHGMETDFAAIVAEVASPDVQGILRPLLDDGAISRETYLEALNTHRPRLQQIYRDYFATHGLAAVAFPTTPLAAEPIGADQRGMEDGDDKPAFQKYDRNVSPASNAGIPSLSLPVGMTASGLPVGITLDAPEGEDAHLLALGAAIESRDGPLPPPKLG